MYSLRDKASTNMRFIGKSIKGAAKRFSSETMGIGVDSDDDEDIMGGLIENDDDDIDGEEGLDSDILQSCGGYAFAEELINSAQENGLVSSVKISVGLRQCCLDEGAVDALAASIVSARPSVLSIDVSMNSVETDIVHELMHADRDSKVLHQIAQRHTDFVERIANVRQRRSNAEEASSDDDECISIVASACRIGDFVNCIPSSYLDLANFYYCPIYECYDS